MAQRIFTILLRRGRLQIYQLITHTRLTKRQIQHGLAVLIQQNLIYHCLDIADDRTYYEANHDAAYALVRSGKIVELVESRFGVLAKDVVQNLLLLGHTKVSDLADAYETANKPHSNGHSKEHPGTNGVNGVNGNHKIHITSAGQLDYVLSRLLHSGFVQPVLEPMLRSPTDKHNLVEKVILHDSYGGQTKGTRQKEELKIKVRNQLKSWRDDGRDWKPVGSSERPGDAVNGVNGRGKKRRLSRGEAIVNGKHPYDEGRLDVSFRLPQRTRSDANFTKSEIWLYGSIMRSA
jgi:DNA-directed RNA polymerase III subunit RPC3